MPIEIVLDTNVCLDLFVFKDPRWEKIMLALNTGTIRASTRKDCREEWLAVLHYSHLPVTDENRQIFIENFDKFIEVREAVPSLIKLPVCTDKDDQKFLEYSRDAQVNVLVSKDKAVLKLAKKMQKLNLFNIETPEKFLHRLTTIPQAKEIISLNHQ
jgi:putative PIN family toxin of toxin-antitoxin system